MNDQALQTTLLDLHHSLSKKGIHVILGGGFGLYLKQTSLLSQPTVRTLLPMESWPSPRSTSDLDVFLPLEILVSLPDMLVLRATIDEMKFEPIAGNQYWQFLMPTNQVKIDLLTGPIDDAVRSKLKIDPRRVRPKGDLHLHAHPVPEALDLAEHLESVSLAGQLSAGPKYSAGIKIPSPFTYLMMKITAFGDQLANPDKNQGRHHALDVYRITSMLTESQFAQTKQQFTGHSASPYTAHVRSLTKDYFSTSRAAGILRMQEHDFFGKNMQLAEFIESLGELVGV